MAGKTNVLVLSLNETMGRVREIANRIDKLTKFIIVYKLALLAIMIWGKRPSTKFTNHYTSL